MEHYLVYKHQQSDISLGIPPEIFTGCVGGHGVRTAYGVRGYHGLGKALVSAGAATEIREGYIGVQEPDPFLLSNRFVRFFTVFGGKTQIHGVYNVYPRDTDGFQLRCDMTPSGGGWTVIQRRIGDSDFYKTWVEYQKGFGDLRTNFWLGNENIHSITSEGVYELLVHMIGPADEVRYTQYKVFAIGDAGSKYKLLLGEYSGDACDSLTEHKGMKFTTKDQENDVWGNNCAGSYTGAWWYGSCHLSNLNGIYGSVEFGKGINWQTFTTHTKSLKEVEMKIRRWSG